MAGKLRLDISSYVERSLLLELTFPLRSVEFKLSSWLYHILLILTFNIIVLVLM